MQPGKCNGTLHKTSKSEKREYSESLSKDKKLKLSKLISRSGHAASAESCLRKIFKYNYNKPNDCVEIT